MNYIKELNAFKDWLSLNQLSANAFALWNALMMINNAVGWKTEFNAPNITISTICGLQNQRLADARNQLVEKNLIHYEPGHRGKAPVYRINSFLTNQASNTDAEQTSTWTHSGVKMDSNLDSFWNIPKHKQKQKRSSRVKPSENNPYTVYKQNYGKLQPAVKKEIAKWCNILGDDVVSYAIVLAIKYGGKTFSYIERILKEWSRRKLTTLDQVKAHEQQKAASKKNTIPFQKRESNRHKALFDELRKELKYHDT